MSQVVHLGYLTQLPYTIAALLAWRAFTHRSIDLGRAAELDVVSASQPAQRIREPGFTGGLRPYPCSSDDVYCVVEEWTFF